MEYFLLDKDNQSTGPFSIDELRQKRLDRSSMVWYQGAEKWVSAGSVESLISIFTRPPEPNNSQVFSKPDDEATSEVLDSVYEERFEIKSLNNNQITKFKKNEFLNRFNIGLGILLHFITLGIFTTIYCGVKYDDLPLIKFDDFGTGKAIGFLFIPFFNIYWNFVFWRTLAKRINLQFALRSQEKPVSVGLATASCILRIIPYVGQFINFLILKPILFAQIQSATNRLVMYNLKNN